jgi:hypothetical protein
MSTKQQHDAVGYQDGNLVAKLATKLVSKILAPPAKPDYIARLDARWRAGLHLERPAPSQRASKSEVSIEE